MTRIVFAAVLLCLTLSTAYAQQAEPAEITFRDDLTLNDQDRVVLTRFVGHAVKYANALTAEGVASKCKESPEMFAWVEFRYLDCLSTSFELTGDTQYLDLLKDRFTLFQDILSTGQDPYLGWYGLPIPPRRPADKPDTQIDELQMNFRAIGLLSRWIELARTQPDYAKANQDTIDSYLELMEKHLYPKWDARGHFAEIAGRGGVYHGLDYPLPIKVTLSHEKLSIMVDGLLTLHRITGDDQYLMRALQVGAWFKSNLQLKDEHYEWMSWVPAGEWDINPDKPDAWRVGWIAPDPNGPWYVASLSIALNLYQHGLLFDDADLERFISTQRTMCWNGDMDHPEYRTVAGVKNQHVKGQFLSHQLANYDPQLSKLAFFGPREAEALTDSASAWKGGANANDYVIQKYLSRPKMQGNKQPYAETGQAFLAKPENKTFYDAVDVKIKNRPVPAKPSEME